MSGSAGFSIVGQCAEYRPVGEMTLAEAIELVRWAIERTRSLSCPKLFVDAYGLKGFPSPGLAERFTMAERWAETAGGSLCTVIVAPEELIEEEKFAVTVARNRGFVMNVFVTEEEARDWLDGQDC